MTTHHHHWFSFLSLSIMFFFCTTHILSSPSFSVFFVNILFIYSSAAHPHSLPLLSSTASLHINAGTEIERRKKNRRMTETLPHTDIISCIHTTELYSSNFHINFLPAVNLHVSFPTISQLPQVDSVPHLPLFLL